MKIFIKTLSLVILLQGLTFSTSSCARKSSPCPETGPMRPEFGAGSGTKKRDKNGHIKKKKPKNLTKK